jgi:tetratricopeptide (TPR) repeat protein
MKKRTYLLLCLSIFFAGFLIQTPNIYAQGGNSVSGIVYGDSGRPVADAHIELLTDTYTTLRRTKTNASGLYYFRGIPNGNYKIRVLGYGTNYEEQTQSVSLVPISAIRGSGAVSEQVNFQLILKPNPNAGPLAAPGVIFAQEVPKEAETLYEDGVKLLREKKDEEGFEKLKKSLEIFPTYFAALDRLGTEYVVRGYYRPAYVLLSKALEVNPRSFSSTLGFGITQFRLNETDKSIKTLEQAVKLYDESPMAHMWLGIALTESGTFDLAEKSLRQANKLSNGKSADVHWQLARLFNKQKRYAEAAEELELYLKYNPEISNRKNVEETIAKLREKVR